MDCEGNKDMIGWLKMLWKVGEMVVWGKEVEIGDWNGDNEVLLSIQEVLKVEETIIDSEVP